MRTKYFKASALLLMIALTSVQCKKSLLQIDPTIPNKTVENYYSTEAEALTAVIATYTPLQAPLILEDTDDFYRDRFRFRAGQNRPGEPRHAGFEIRFLEYFHLAGHRADRQGIFSGGKAGNK